jgi:hypothetical protein
MRLLHLRVGPASTLGGLRAPSPSTHSSVMAFYLCGSASVSLLFFSSSRAPHSRRASTASRSLVFKAVAFCRSRPLSTSLSLSLSLSSSRAALCSSSRSASTGSGNPARERERLQLVLGGDAGWAPSRQVMAEAPCAAAGGGSRGGRL